MANAVSLAQENGKRCKHVAFILKGKRVLAVGVNSSKTHPLAKQLKFQTKYTESQCAELNACLKLGLTHRDGLPDFSTMIMVIVRVNNDGSLGLSQPCKGCQHLLAQCGFKKVYYSNANGQLINSRTAPANQACRAIAP